MESKNELFMLIRSMDKNEKGYFRKFCKIHGNKKDGNYIRLFDFIANMDSYSDVKVREKFKGEKFIAQLSVTKHYLRNLIIKSFRNYYSDSNPNIEMLNGMTEVQLLADKRLYESATRLINKLKKQADEDEAFSTSLFLLQMESIILDRKSLYQEILDTTPGRVEKEIHYLTQYKNWVELYGISDMLSAAINIEGAVQGRLTAQIKEYANHPTLADADTAISYRAKLMRYNTLNQYYLRTGDFKKALEVSIALVDLFNAHPNHIKRRPFNYFVSLTELTGRYCDNRMYKEASECVDRVQALLSDSSLKFSEDNKVDIAVSVQERKLFISYLTAAYANGIDAEKKLVQIAKTKPIRPAIKLTSAYLSAWCYLGLGRPDEALIRANLIIHEEYKNMRRDISLATYTLNILIHYDLGNYTFIKHLLKTTKNFITSNGFSTKGWSSFQKSINEIVKAKISNNDKEVKKLFQSLSESLEQCDFIDFDRMKWWLDTKLKQE